MERQLITLAGRDRLREELELLRKNELPRNIQAIAEARALGDLSENAEFHAAKERQSIIAAKIADLERTLAHVEVVDPLPEPAGRVVFGALVTVYDAETDEQQRYQLVGQAESDAARGKISLSSPIGQAVLGKEIGDEVRVKTPGGLRILEIMDVIRADEKE